MRSRGWSVRLKSLAGAWKADLGHQRHVMAKLIKLKAISDLMKAHEAEGAAVWLLVMFLRNEACKSLESNHGRRTQTFTCGQDQRSKGIMLHFEDMLFVCSPLLVFMSSVASIGRRCTIR